MDLQKYVADLAEVKDLITKLEERRDEIARKVFYEGVQHFFAETPEVHALTWIQYTPYFNDGDACNFSVGDVDYVLDEFEEPGGGGAEFGYYTPFMTLTEVDTLFNLLSEVETTYSEGDILAESYKDCLFFHYVTEYDRSKSEPTYRPSRVASAYDMLSRMRYEILEQLKENSRRDIIVSNLREITDLITLTGDDSKLELFGDHVRVTLRAGLEPDIEEYDHD